MIPSRACSNCVMGVNPAGGRHSPLAASRTQSSGMKSHAVLSDGAGMPGVSGELNVQGVPTRPRCANAPGDVPCRSVDGLSPSGGSSYDGAAAADEGPDELGMII